MNANTFAKPPAPAAAAGDAAAAEPASRIARLRSISHRLAVNSAVVGVVLTVVVVVLDAGGALGQLERWFFDHRAAYFQFFSPPPSDRILHIDIDDGSLESIGRWPWARSVQGELVDEIRMAGAAATALDVLLVERELREMPDGRVVDEGGDAVLADAVRASGNILVPSGISFDRPSILRQAMREALVQDLALSPEQLAGQLRSRFPGVTDLDRRVTDRLISVRKEAVYGRIMARPGWHDVPREELRAAVLNKADMLVTHPLDDVFDSQYERAVATRTQRRFQRPPPEGFPPLFQSELKFVPIRALGEAAALAGFVDYPTSEAGIDPDGRVRCIPLLVSCDGQVFPQMSLSLACGVYGTDLSSLRYEGGRLIIPRRPEDGPPVEIPTRTFYSAPLGQDMTLLMDIPWVGGGDWTTMYDPERRVARQHLSMDAVWAPCQTRRQIAKNNKQADSAIPVVTYLVSPERAKAYINNPPPLRDPVVRNAMIESLLKETKDTIDLYSELTPEERQDPELARVLAAAQSLPRILAESVKLEKQLADQRKALHDQIDGKAVFVGWTASATTDQKPTSIHDSLCPGVVIHATILNAILTGHFWSHAPAWVSTLITLLMGLGATAAAAWLTPTRAMTAAAVMLLGYMGLNGVALFDYGNLIVGMAGPFMAVVLVWNGCTLSRLLFERFEKARVTKRFRHYVDPALVDYALAHPDEAELKGQLRELTCVFTDLQGFTKLSTQLGPAIVPLLNEFLGRMVPVIRRNRGYVNKFLGDGIMFLHGAPEPHDGHARDAIAAVLDMQKATAEFNREIVARGLQPMTLRAGVSTGEMIVGDAGPDEGGDYTALGDLVNLGSRLESANKAVGTTVLVSARTVELAAAAAAAATADKGTNGKAGNGKGDGTGPVNGDTTFLVRPIGKLCVVGRAEGVMVYEPLARTAEATEEQKRLASLTTEMVEHFLAGRVRECAAALDRMEQAFGPSKLTSLYRARCDYYLGPASFEGFDCQIVLTEK